MLLIVKLWCGCKGGAISYVIGENVPYCGTNIVGPDQTPRIMHGVWSGPLKFVAHEHIKITLFVAPIAVLIKKNYRKSVKTADLC